MVPMVFLMLSLMTSSFFPNTKLAASLMKRRFSLIYESIEGVKPALGLLLKDLPCSAAGIRPYIVNPHPCVSRAHLYWILHKNGVSLSRPEAFFTVQCLP